MAIELTVGILQGRNEIGFWIWDNSPDCMRIVEHLALVFGETVPGEDYPCTFSVPIHCEERDRAKLGFDLQQLLSGLFPNRGQPEIIKRLDRITELLEELTKSKEVDQSLSDLSKKMVER